LPLNGRNLMRGSLCAWRRDWKRLQGLIEASRLKKRESLEIENP